MPTRFDIASDRSAGGTQGPLFYQAPTGGVVNGLPALSWDEAAVQLNRGGHSWANSLGEPITITYAFRSSVPLSELAQLPDGVSVFTPFNEAQIQAAEEAMRLWSELANINLVRVGEGTTGPGAYSNNATILLGNFMVGPPQFSAFAFLPDPNATGAEFLEGNVWVNVSRDYDADPLTFPRGMAILVHEIGHALGLLHPADYGGGAASGVAYPTHAQHWQDTGMFTQMSYFSAAFTGGIYPHVATGQMMHDIAAIQRLYGANMTTRAGDTTYGFNSNAGHDLFNITDASINETPIFTIWDAGGIDTLDLSGYSTNSEIDLREESFSSAGSVAGGLAAYNIAIARGAVVEIAIGGGGADTIIGNAVANWLYGNGGADVITGGAGADIISAGAGNDIIHYNFGDGVDDIDGGLGIDRIVTFGNAGGETLDLVWNGLSFTAFKGGAVNSIEQAIADLGGGNDWLRHHNSALGVTINLALGAATGFISIANIENAVGSAFADTLTGSALANIIRGGNGDDLIDGGGENDTLVGDDGADTLLGGDGADVLYGLAGVDMINGGAGADTIHYAFGESIDVIDGGDDVDTIVCLGNSGAETLEVAWDGESFTFFKGGAVTSIEQAQADMGLGGDWLRYTNATVAISVDLGANTASGFITLANVENAAGGAFNDTLTGSSVANNLLGNAGADVIDGAAGNDTINGGAGQDTIIGGAGSDTLIGGGDGDIFVFATGSGVDTVSDFDANAAGGQDLLDISLYGVTAGDFGARVTIADLGTNTLVTIDGVNTIMLFGVTGDGANVITQADFLLA